MPEKLKKKGGFRIFDRRLVAVAARARGPLLLTISLGVLSGLFVVSQAFLLSRVVNGVFLGRQGLPLVLPWMLSLLGIILARGLLTWLHDLSASAVALRVKSGLRARLLSRVFDLGPAYVGGQRAGEISSAATEGIEAIGPYFSLFLPQLVIALAVPLTILVVVFLLDPLSGFLLLFTGPLIPFFMYLVGSGAEEGTRRQYAALARLSSHFLESLQGLTTLKVFGQSKAHARTVAKVSDTFHRTSLKVLRLTFLSALALEFLATLSTAVIAVEIGLRLLYGYLQFPEALFILVLAPEFYLPLRMLGLRFHAAIAGTSAARDIFETIDAPVRGNDEAEVDRRPGAHRRVAGLRFVDVSYAYPGAESPALHDISFEVHEGQQAAVVGPSGGGKSTLAGLVLGFIQPASGRILTLFDDGSVEDGPPPNSSLAWVSQRPYLFHDTISVNLRLGRPEASQDEQVVAAQAAQLHDFIEGLPNGYETVIGEGGARLSTGEAQRLAYARAYLKKAPVLVLDEPTSSLDPRTEELIADSARRVPANQIVITIAHRLNTVHRADRIFVLDVGRIVESGSHVELIQAGGLYAHMVTAHARGATPAAEDTLQPTAYQPPLAPSVTVSAGVEPGPSPSVFMRLLSFLRGSWGWAALSIMLGGLTIGSSVALMGTSAWLISSAALHPSLGDLSLAVLGVRVFGIARAVFRYLERLVSHHVTFRLLGMLRVWFYTRIEPLAPARLIQHRAGDVLNRFVADVQSLEDFYVRVVAPPVTAAVVLLGTAWFLGRYDLRLSLVAAAVFALLGLALPPLTMRLGRRPAAAMLAQRSALRAAMVDSIQGLADIRVFGRQQDRMLLLRNLEQGYAEAQRSLATSAALQGGLSVFLQHFGAWCVLLLAIPRVTQGGIAGVMLAALVLLTLASFEAAAPLPLAGQMWAAARQAARRVFELVDAVPAVVDHPAGTGLMGASARSAPSIEFDRLSFTYPGAAEPVLRDITFEIPRGGSVAIVGPTGAGKSTLLHLLLRFWDYDTGDIRIDGGSLKLYLQDDVRGRMSLVSPGLYLFNASLFENIRLGRPYASRAEVEAAARTAGLHDFVAGLPAGYDTWIGEAGLRLSGGERQRVAIARTVLKDAPVLLMDEPTAHLDSETELQVLGNLLDFMRSKTAILVTHRLVALERMGQILVLDEGRIVQRGTHTQLLEQPGLYQTLWEIQNRVKL